MITINGKKYSGNNISINNNKVVIDGKTINENSKEIYIYVDGNIESLSSDIVSQLIVDGDVNTLTTTNGDCVVLGDVTNNIKTTNGTVKISGSVGGNVKTTNGNVKYNK